MIKKQLHIKNISIALLSVLFAFLLIGVFFQRHALACEMLPFMSYYQVDDKIFFASDIPKERINELIQIVDLAKQRLSDVYGVPMSTPWILVTSDIKTTNKWGANDTGGMHRMPWNSCIIIGPQGQNVDVIAHELLHAEIQDRVGLLRFLIEIPVWFDEGVALTLDYREPFLPENIDLNLEKIVTVKELEKHKDFFSGNIRENYQAARLAVISLILEERFYDDLERIKRGESFQMVFKNPARSK